MTTRADLGQLDFEWDDATRTLKVYVEKKLILELTRSQLSVNGTLNGATVDADDLEFSGEARGDIIRRGATNWERHAAKTSGQILVGDGTDLVSVAVTGDVTINGSGVTAIGPAKVLASMLGANLRTGHIPLDIFTARIISSDAIQNTTEAGVPDGNTSPSIARVNGATDKQGRLIWAATAVEEIQFAPFVYPQDLDDTADVNVHILAAMAGATDTPELTVGYFEGVGDTDAGGTAGNVTGTTPAHYVCTITAANIGANQPAATVTLTPGAHGTDALYVYAAWIEYTRRT